MFDQEQIAVAAERDTNDLKKVQYMEPFIGEVFDGKISSITSFGMFVELENGIDGLVHIATMDDDYYFLTKNISCWLGAVRAEPIIWGRK